MFIINNKWFFTLFTSKWVRGIAIFPFIFCKHAYLLDDKSFLTHERIHIRQQIEMLVIPFYIWYVLEFIIRILQYKNKEKAYRNISFEREAYENENNMNYLKDRKFWSFWQYL